MSLCLSPWSFSSQVWDPPAAVGRPGCFEADNVEGTFSNPLLTVEVNSVILNRVLPDITAASVHRWNNQYPEPPAYRVDYSLQPIHI